MNASLILKIAGFLKIVSAGEAVQNGPYIEHEAASLLEEIGKTALPSDIPGLRPDPRYYRMEITLTPPPGSDLGARQEDIDAAATNLLSEMFSTQRAAARYLVRLGWKFDVIVDGKAVL